MQYFFLKNLKYYYINIVSRSRCLNTDILYAKKKKPAAWIAFLCKTDNKFVGESCSVDALGN